MKQALPVFATTLFLSAFLLFSIQPMFARMVLPILGGAPSVWSVAMVFFQTVLLAGYAYAHALTRFASIRQAAMLHLGVMAVAFLALPIALAPMAHTPPEQGEALWLIGVFAISVGAPFFAVSANGPLLQAWFARSDHPQAGDPYFLYGASNVGSFVALIAYPLVVEPFVALGDQARSWTVGFALLFAAIVACAASASATPGASTREIADEAAAPSWRERLSWIVLAAVPSGLLVAVTAHISTDVAAAPLLWVAPLALFLATFVLVFRDRPTIGDVTLSRAQILLFGAVAAQALSGAGNLALTLVLHLAMFFVSAMACHSALYARRPGPGRLTEFYMLMSLGGVIGGVFCGLAAPLLFSTVLEYPMLLVAALFCSTPAIASFRDRSDETLRLPQGRAGLAFAAAIVANVAVAFFIARGYVAAFCVVVAALLLLRAPRRAALFAAAASLFALVYSNVGAATHSYRSFFGVHKVQIVADQFRVLINGATVHGAMRVREADGSPTLGDPAPTTYYADSGPLAEALRSVRSVRGGHIRSAFLVGLGTGALACQMRRDEPFTFFEIDPVVARIASDPSLFRFLDVCGKNRPIVLGDARLTLARQSGSADVVVIDAFSSDAIPTHLLTKEAFEIYLSRLDERGVVVLHISNKHLDLGRVVARTAGEVGLQVWARFQSVPSEAFERTMQTSSYVVALARRPQDLGAVAAEGGDWRLLSPDAAVSPWTDDYSNILQAMADHYWR